MKKLYLVLFGLFIFSSYLFAQVEITSRLSDAMLEAQKEGTTIPAVIVLKDQLDIQALDKLLYDSKANLQERAYTVITKLQNHAERTHEKLLNFLKTKSKEKIPDYQNFWICNAILLEVKPDVILELSNRTDIALLDLQDEIRRIEPVEKSPAPKSNPNGSEPGLKVINADKLWRLGITGKGVLVMNLDDGVDGLHPALAARWRGNDPGVPASAAWFDPAGSTFPVGYDDHGTHTMGTITGLDANTNDTIGVAFGAKWIAAVYEFYFPTIRPANLLAAMQWAINPDGYPETNDDMPCVINNSWGFSDHPDCDQYLKNAVDALESAGIATVWAAGNEGPDFSTMITPAMINTTEMNFFSVGALDGNISSLPISSISSRGPTYCTGLGNQIKPEVSAPGVDVRSSIPNGGYLYWGGTSMAAPHVAGAIALLKQVFPNKTGTELKQMLYNTATDLGPVGEDNTYGKGVIDVYAAFLANAVLTNPRTPVEVNAYSDFTMPTIVQISWIDPIQYVSGNPLTNFEINIFRDNLLIANVASGIENYIDNGLTMAKNTNMNSIHGI